MDTKAEGNSGVQMTSPGHTSTVQSQSVDMDSITHIKAPQTLDDQSHQTKKYSLFCVIITVVVLCLLVALMTAIIVFEISQKNDTSDSSTSTADDTNGYEVLIIGAGMTGLTNLYILSTASEETYTTLMVERNNRIGGKTFSSHLTYNGSSITFEMGAMRFVHWNKQSQLLSHLGLCDKIIGFEDTTSYANPTKNNDEGFYLWRNHRKVVEDINDTNYWPEIYNFNDRVK